MSIPIANLFHLASYAFRSDPSYFAAAIDHPLAAEAPHHIDALVGLALIEAERLCRRGLARGYVEREAILPAPRGRILVGQSVAAGLLARPALACRFEEFTPDIPLNRMLARVLVRVLRDERHASWLRHDAARLLQQLDGVEPPSAREVAAPFERPVLHRHNAHYRPLVDLCELLEREWFPGDPSDEAERGWGLRAIERERRFLSRLFERFLYGWLQRHTPSAVGAEVLTWPSPATDDVATQLLPTMRTDITLRGPGQVRIIEAKFYAQPLVERRGALRLRSGHLYQLLTYMHRTRAKAGADVAVDGLLCYAQVGETLDLHYELEGFPLRVLSVDLAGSWSAIEARLRSRLVPATVAADSLLPRC